MRTYPRLLSYARPHWKVLGAAFSSMLVTSVLNAGPLTMIIPLVDRVLADKKLLIPDDSRIPGFVIDLVSKFNAMPRFEILNMLLIGLVILTCVKAAAEYAYTYSMSEMSHRVTRDLRSAVYEKILRLPLKFFGHARSGALVSRITYDTGIVRDAISEGLKDLLFQPVELVAYIIVLFSVQIVFSIPGYFLLIICFVLPLMVYPIMRLGKRLKKISRQSQEQMAEIHSSLFESISGMRVVQAFGMEEYEKKRFKGFNWAYYRTMMLQIARLTAVPVLTDVVLIACASLVIWFGGREVIYRGMSPGAFIAFLAALFSLSRPFKRLSRLHSLNQSAITAAERIFDLLDTPEEVAEPENAVFVGGLRDRIEFKNVSFAYEPEKQVLRDVNLSIGVGEIVALVGPSGTGKSTLANLVPRFYDPVSGDVTIDGTPLRRVSLKSLRHQIAVVTQDVILFNDTIASNIAYGRSDVPQSAIEDAARVANAHEFIKKLPNGYQTLVGDRGFKLSGGEKQRVAIARAVFKNPPILILDEATSALDSENEKLVQIAIGNLMKGRTVLVIAHRLSTIRNATRIIVLENGRIIEQGTHDELVRRDGPYRKIYEMQIAG